MAAMLATCRAAAQDLYRHVDASPLWRTLAPPALDIVVFAPRRATASGTSAATQRIFDEAAGQGWHLAVTRLPTAFVRAHAPDLEGDRNEVACLRSVLMKPEHGDVVPALARVLDDLADRSG
jgi:glutamate/tyrosine decarboxylase-like PLP-dependent enzyme